MLAINHATSAVSGVLFLSVYFQQPFFLPFIIFVIFGAILPDIDHQGSELGKIFYPVAKILPHRGVTHSVAGMVILGTGFYFLLGTNRVLTYILLAFSFLGLLFAEKILYKRARHIQNLSLNLASRKQVFWAIKLFSIILHVFFGLLVLLVWQEKFRQEILVLLGFGYFFHLIGDFVTKEGIPIFWPMNSKYGLSLFRTGKTIEILLGFVFVAANFWLFYKFWTQFDLGSQTYWQSYLNLNWN